MSRGDEDWGEDVVVRRKPVQVRIIPKVYDPESGQDGVEYMEMYEMAGESNNWGDEEKLRSFPHCLQGAAEKWFLSYKTTKGGFANLVWEEVRVAFEAAFTPGGREQSAEIRLQKRVQRSGESLESFIYDVENLSLKANPDISQRQTVINIVKRLNPEYGQAVMMEEIATVEALKARLNVAHAYQLTMQHQAVLKGENKVYSIDSTSDVAATRNYSDKGDINKKIEKMVMVMDQFADILMQMHVDGSSKGSGRPKRKEGRECYFCKKVGHIMENCWLLKGRLTVNEEGRRPSIGAPPRQDL